MINVLIFKVDNNWFAYNENYKINYVGESITAVKYYMERALNTDKINYILDLPEGLSDVIDSVDRNSSTYLEVRKYAICRLIAYGLSYNDIASLFNISRQRIHQISNSMNIHSKAPKPGQKKL